MSSHIVVEDSSLAYIDEKFSINFVCVKKAKTQKGIPLKLLVEIHGINALGARKRDVFTHQIIL